MARLHSRKKGKAGRKRQKPKTAPKWFAANPQEVKEEILKMVRAGVQPSKIGIILRDKYGIPTVKVALGVSLSQFLKKEGVAQEYPEDLLSLIRRAVKVSAHLKTSKKDVHNKVKLSHIESKISRLVKYYTHNGRLPSDWKYDREKAVLLVK